ncbi:MAG: MFS transporter [Leucobacter sp.]|nr:MFS transporter [Leucobacter sp.]
MTNEEVAAARPELPTDAAQPTQPAAAGEGATAASAAEASPAAEPTLQPESAEAEAEFELTETQHTPVAVGLQRSVRFGRIIISTTVLGGVLGVLASLLFPVVQGADYELRQVAGLMAVVGAAIGLTVGAILALLLGIIARRQRGQAMAVQTDVR